MTCLLVWRSGGVLVVDDSGDRKDGSKTAHVGRQWLGRYGKTGSGVVTVTTVWAGEQVYCPVHAVPDTPAKHFAKGTNDPGFGTRLAIGAGLAIRAREAGFTFRAVCADCAYGDQDGFRAELAQAGLPFVMALRPRRGTWARAADAHTPVGAARALAWGGPGDPGDWTEVRRTFRDGHAGTWRAADAELGGWGPDGVRRLVVAAADPGTLPDRATWYLVTSLPRPGGPREPGSPHPAAGLAEITRIYAIRNWIEQGCKQVKGRAGPGRLPGPLGHRDPPPPGPGQLRLQLLPGCLVRPSAATRRHTASARSRPRREGGPDPPARRAGPGRSAPCAPGSPRGSRCSAGGLPGRTRPRPASCKP